MPILHDLVSAGNDFGRIYELLRAGENPNSLDEDGNTPLHIASVKVITSSEILEDNLQVARELINFGAGVDMKNRDGCAPLHLAVSSRKLEMVQCLLQANAQINILNYRNETPLIIAAKILNFQIVKELLKQQASVNLLDFLNNSALHYALTRRTMNVNMVEEFLRHGCELTIRNISDKRSLVFYIYSVISAPVSEILKAKYLLRLFLFQCYIFNTLELKLIKCVDQRKQCNLYRFYEHCRDEITRIKGDFLASDCTVYAIALRGFNYRLSKIDEHTPFYVYDKVLVRLIKGNYPIYRDIIVSGICTTYLKKKFADGSFSLGNNSRVFLNFDTLYLISSYLSHLDMLNTLIASS